MTLRNAWFIWISLTMLACGYLVYAVNADRSPTKRIFLPGETTHGHYQIELACDACHTSFMGVKQDACVECHGADLKRENDTHPASKFNSPTNAERLSKIDAQQCIACHREHVPDRTAGMGLSVPTDYCFYCHEDVAEQRPSHVGMTHDSCSTAGCHNYHDNKALYENFLYKNCDQPDVLDNPHVLLRKLLVGTHESTSAQGPTTEPLKATDADGPTVSLKDQIVDDWAASAHARVGVNCRDCHDMLSDDEKVRTWSNRIGTAACQECHESQVDTFQRGRHGMRLAAGLSPMTPAEARHPMHLDAAHRQLDCSACHPPHTYDTQFAAAEACLTCHNDAHSRNYKNSSHYTLWQQELSGDGALGTGVSCATCHMPRVDVDGKVEVDHNQNYNLRPNEKMIRSVCMNCHGFEFTLNSLADPALIEGCFDGKPVVNIDSAQMAKRWFEEKERQRSKRANETNPE